jgi:hypothetical protein
MDSSLTVVIALLAAVQFALQGYCIYSLWAKEVAPQNQKLVWTVVLILFGLLGPVIYLAWGRYRLGESRNQDRPHEDT